MTKHCEFIVTELRKLMYLVKFNQDFVNKNEWKRVKMATKNPIYYPISGRFETVFFSDRFLLDRQIVHRARKSWIVRANRESCAQIRSDRSDPIDPIRSDRAPHGKNGNFGRTIRRARHGFLISRAVWGFHAKDVAWVDIWPHSWEVWFSL